MNITRPITTIYKIGDSSVSFFFATVSTGSKLHADNIIVAIIPTVNLFIWCFLFSIVYIYPS
jgi:hypothetical protein